MTITINNNPDEWKNLKNEIENGLLNNHTSKEKNLRIEVYVKNNPENLIYSFPIVDSARILRWKCSINIVIDSQTTELINAVSHFLCVQSIIREGLTITINGKKLEHQARFGKIQPVIAVTNREGSFCYQHLYEPQISFDLLFQLKPILISSIIYRKNDIATIEKLNNIISSHEDLVSQRFLKTNNNILTLHQTDKSIIWSELFEVHQNDNINLILCKFIMSNIIYMLGNLSGNRENKLSKQQKEELANKLFDYFNDTVKDLPLLSLYIWSILLRFLLIKKELIHPDTQKQDLFKPVMETTANRAISFGEGLYQLIENSCFHSCIHNGYFYLRVYGKNKENDLKEEEKQIRDLQTLAQRYSPHNFSKDTDLHLEFCFIDSAFDGRGISGMIDHYNRTHQYKAANSLIELFESNPESEEDLTEHYGLRFFRRTVFNNYGSFIISTPNSQNINEGYMYRLANGNYTHKNNKVYSGTVYQVVFPLILNYRSNTVISKNDSDDIFETENITKTIKPFCISLKTTPEYKTIRDKNKCIENVRNELDSLFPKDKELAERIVCINPKNFNFSHIEILAKALIRVMLKRKHLSLKIALFN